VIKIAIACQLLSVVTHRRLATFATIVVCVFTMCIGLFNPSFKLFDVV
jgi:hypothetical protein